MCRTTKLEDLQTMMSLSSVIRTFQLSDHPVPLAHTRWMTDFLVYYSCCKIPSQSLHTNQEGQIRTCYLSSLSLIICTHLSSLVSSESCILSTSVIAAFTSSKPGLRELNSGLPHSFANQFVCALLLLKPRLPLIHPLLSYDIQDKPKSMRSKRTRMSTNHA